MPSIQYIGYHGRMDQRGRSHIAALMRRDLMDAVRNRTVLVMVAASAALGWVFRTITVQGVRFEPGEAPAFLMTFVIGCAPAFVGCVMTLYVMAEERERGMYLTLAEAGVSLAEVAVAKLLSALVATLAVEGLLCLLLGLPMGLGAQALLLSVPAMLPVLLAGLAFGLLATEQMASSVFAVPITLMATMPLIAFLSAGLRQVWWLMPGGQAAELARALCGMESAASPALLVGLMVAWAAACGAFSFLAHRCAAARLKAEFDRAL